MALACAPSGFQSSDTQVSFIFTIGCKPLEKAGFFLAVSGAGDVLSLALLM